MTTIELAKALGVNVSTIKTYIAAGMPMTRGGAGLPNAFDLAAVNEWREANGRTGTPGRPRSKQSGELEELKLRKQQEILRRYARENGVAEGKLIDREEERVKDVRKIITARNRLLAMGATLSPRMEGATAAEIRALIDTAVEDVVREFAA